MLISRDDPVKKLEQVFILVTLVSVVFINYFVPQKVAIINFYFLPVIVAGYLAGVRLSVLGALFCVLLVAIYATLYPNHFTMPRSRGELYLHLLAWGGFLILAGAVVGRQQERIHRQIEQAMRLNAELRESNDSLRDARTATMLGLAKLTEYRDQETGGHLERMREYCRVIAAELATTASHAALISEEFVADIYQSSILHDIGKVGISDTVLRKPGPLSAEEYENIKRHTALGGDALQAVERQIGGESFLTMGKEVAYYHHERWDGSGYPAGLCGEQIPLSAQIVAVADVYDAVTSKRVYKRSYSHAEAVDLIRDGRGQLFAPAVVDAFLRRIDEVQQIRASFQDIPSTAPLSSSALVPPATASSGSG